MRQIRSIAALSSAGLLAIGVGPNPSAALAMYQQCVEMAGTCFFTESVFGGGEQGRAAQQAHESRPLFKTTRVWGALVYDSGTKAWSFAVADKKKDEAKAAAMEHCRNAGGTNCLSMLTYSNQCAAVARAFEGDLFLAGQDSVNTGTQPEDAAANALASCKADWGKECKIVVNHCTRISVQQVR